MISLCAASVYSASLRRVHVQNIHRRDAVGAEYAQSFFSPTDSFSEVLMKSETHFGRRFFA